MTPDPALPPSLDRSALARAASTSDERLAELVRAGILQPDADGHFEQADTTRIMLAEALVASGIPLDAIRQAIDAGALSFDFVSDAVTFGSPPADLTVREQAEQLGLSTEALIRIYAMWGLPTPGPDDQMREDDRIIFREWILMMQFFNFDERTLARSAQLVGDAMRSIVRWTIDFLEENVGVPTRAAGGSQMDVVRFAARNSPVTVPSVERQLMWMYRRATEHESIQFIVESIEATLEAAGIPIPKQERPPAILFADLSDYTGLTERMGDRAAAEQADALAWVAQQLAVECRGRLVKRLGDGVMLHFADPSRAVAFGLDLHPRLTAEDLPDAHVGIAAGAVVAREGDFYGRTVNLAARVLGHAAAGEVLVTKEVAEAAGAGPSKEEFGFDPIGSVELKGMGQPVDLFRARRLGSKAG